MTGMFFAPSANAATIPVGTTESTDAAGTPKATTVGPELTNAADGDPFPNQP